MARRITHDWPRRLRAGRSAATLFLLMGGCGGDAPMAPTEPLPSGIGMAVDHPQGRPAACLPDSKLLGRFLLTAQDEPGTWWHLMRVGMDAAGLTDYLAALEGWFGRDFVNLDEGIIYLLDQASVYDANGNGHICAYQLRGTRRHLGDPDYTLTTFSVTDDKYSDR